MTPTTVLDTSQDTDLVVKEVAYLKCPLRAAGHGSPEVNCDSLHFVQSSGETCKHRSELTGHRVARPNVSLWVGKLKQIPSLLPDLLRSLHKEKEGASGFRVG